MAAKYTCDRCCRELTGHDLIHAGVFKDYKHNDFKVEVTARRNVSGVVSGTGWEHCDMCIECAIKIMLLGISDGVLANELAGILESRMNPRK